MKTIPKYIKTSQYAKLVSQKQRTIIRKFHNGQIPGYQDPNTKTIYLENPEYTETKAGRIENTGTRAILYARVSSASNRKSLDGQIERLRSYAAAKGYIVTGEVKEIASGLNDQRPKFCKLLERDDYDILLGEHKDRITRFGYNYLEILLERAGIKLEVINHAENEDNELVDDFVSIITSFCNRIYGRRRKDKTQKIIEELSHEKEQAK